MLRRLAAAALLAASAWTPAAAQAPVRDPAFRPVEERARARIAGLEAEIALLERLRGAQQELAAHNEGRARLGAAPAALDAGLCRDAALARWCAVLPATFGRQP